MQWSWSGLIISLTDVFKRLMAMFLFLSGMIKDFVFYFFKRRGWLQVSKLTAMLFWCPMKHQCSTSDSAALLLQLLSCLKTDDETILNIVYICLLLMLRDTSLWRSASELWPMLQWPAKSDRKQVRVRHLGSAEVMVGSLMCWQRARQTFELLIWTDVVLYLPGCVQSQVKHPNLTETPIQSEISLSFCPIPQIPQIPGWCICLRNKYFIEL